MRTDLSAEFVRSLLDYDPETGVFRWRNYWKSVVPGRIAGRVNGKGYGSISIKGSHYASHRLAWLHYYGEWPSNQIDHINRNKVDNSIENLRVVTGSENCRNRSVPKHYHTSRVKGVCRRKDTGKWQVQICLADRKIKYLGVFNTEEEASAAYARAFMADQAA